MDRLRRLKRQWVLGFGVLMMLGLSAFAFGIAAAVLVPIVGASAIALGVPLPNLDYMDALEISAILWLPLSAGVVMPEIAGYIAQPIREIEDAKRKADLAPYLRKPR